MDALELDAGRVEGAAQGKLQGVLRVQETRLLNLAIQSLRAASATDAGLLMFSQMRTVRGHVPQRLSGT